MNGGVSEMEMAVDSFCSDEVEPVRSSGRQVAACGAIANRKRGGPEDGGGLGLYSRTTVPGSENTGDSHFCIRPTSVPDRPRRTGIVFVREPVNNGSGGERCGQGAFVAV